MLTEREGTHLVHIMRLRKLLAALSAEEQRNKGNSLHMPSIHLSVFE